MIMKRFYIYTRFLLQFSLGFWAILSPSVNAFSQLVTVKKTDFELTKAVIYTDSNAQLLVKRAAVFLQQDIERVTGKKPAIVSQLDKTTTNYIVIGSAENSALLKKWQAAGKLNLKQITGKWEAYSIQSITGIPGLPSAKALVIAGSDRRGTAYGVFELSKQIGVSPWYWWADVPVVKKDAIYINTSTRLSDAPKVKYRGIFINDEAPVSVTGPKRNSVVSITSSMNMYLNSFSG